MDWIAEHLPSFAQLIGSVIIAGPAIVYAARRAARNDKEGNVVGGAYAKLVADQQKRTTALEAAIEKMQIAMDKKDARIEKLELEVAEGLGAISERDELRRRVATLEAKVVTLSETNAHQEEQITTSQARIGELTRKLQIIDNNSGTF